MRNLFARGPAWHAGTLVGFDLETTGVDTTTDRVVTAAVVHVDAGGSVTRIREWLVDSGVRIPAAAGAVHGVSTEMARAGLPARQALAEIVDELRTAWQAGLPVVVFNAPYDLTLLDAEAVRSGLPRLRTQPWWRSATVVDPLVLDRGLDRYRRGKRTLGATAEHYGIPPFAAHSATADAVAAVAIARAVATRHPAIRSVDARALHRAQVRWHRTWAKRLRRYLRSKGRTDAEVDTAWPLRDPVVGRHRAPARRWLRSAWAAAQSHPSSA